MDIYMCVCVDIHIIIYIYTSKTKRSLGMSTPYVFEVYFHLGTLYYVDWSVVIQNKQVSDVVLVYSLTQGPEYDRSGPSIPN